jgi:hypothetical protein
MPDLGTVWGASMQESLQPPEASRATRCPIILVHGTWGRGFFPKDQLEGSCEDSPTEASTDARSEGAKQWFEKGFLPFRWAKRWFEKRWFEKGSEFRKTLEERLKGLSLECSFWPFRWSGANSVFARDRAATKLADELKTHLQNRDIMPIIIAHSHGGNVALRALSHVEDANRVRIVTLATPFLRVFVRPPLKILRSDSIRWNIISAISYQLLVTAVLLMVTALAKIVGSDRSTLWVIIASVLGGLFIPFFYVWLLGSSLLAKPSGSPARRAHDVQQAAFFPPISASGPRMLVIRGVDDEASLTLAASSIGSRLSSLVFFLVIPAVWLLGFALFILGVISTDLTFGCAFAAGGCLFLPGICKSAFGREFLTTAFICETAADSTPDTAARIDAVTLSSAEAGWRHKIYEHPKCVDEIVRWIRDVVQNADDNPKDRASSRSPGSLDDSGGTALAGPTNSERGQN